MELFQKAKAVFVPGLADQKNVLGAFRKNFHTKGEQKTELIIAAHTFYRVYLNGAWLGTGPATAPFGYLKADRYDLTELIRPEAAENQLAIEVIGYIPEQNFATNETSCLIAEVRSGDDVLCATDGSWECGVLRQKDCFVETLSFGRRVPLEAYSLDASYTAWRIGTIPDGTACEELVTDRVILERGVCAPDTSILRTLRMTGIYSMNQKPYDGRERSWWETDEYIARCGGAQLSRPSVDCLSLEDCAFDGESEEAPDGKGNQNCRIFNYHKPAALEFKLEAAETGFIGIEFFSEEPVVIDITWNDYLDDRGRLPVRADSVNRVIRLKTQGGSFQFESMEPHYVKYIKVIVRGGGTVELKNLYLRTYRFPDPCAAEFVCSDMALNRIYDSARRTLLTNMLGFFFDSPERERGGWAGDSYWTGRAAFLMLSDTTVERAMLFDFLLSGDSQMLEGSFPSCCSGNLKNDPVIMYSWNLFVLLELTDYCRRTGDEALKTAYRARVETFMKASRALKNELGVLENIPGSMFIDWSVSNDALYTQPICTAANALYAMVAERLAELYGREDYRAEAEQIRSVFRGVYKELKTTKNDLFTMYPFLTDSMTLENGRLRGNGVYSEAAQYYYFWTGLLTRESAPELWQILKEQFGPAPAKYRGTAHLKVANCGVFFGHMLRFELLGRFGETQLLEKEMKTFCGYMADQDPGTFWETMSGEDSRNHGFGAHFGAQLVQNFLGAEIPDRIRKRIRFAPQPGTLKWAKGSFRNEDGRFCAAWNRNQDGFELHISVPSGYTAEVALPEAFCAYEEMTVNGTCRPFARRLQAEGRLDVRLARS